MTIRDYHYPSGELKMPIENDFNRVFGAIKELEARVERLEDSASTPLSVILSEENDRLIDENNQLHFVLSILAAVKDDDWIEWHGGECPVGEDVLVEVKMRYGDVIRGRSWDWKHHGHALDIIAYRIAR